MPKRCFVRSTQDDATFLLECKVSILNLKFTTQKNPMSEKEKKKKSENAIKISTKSSKSIEMAATKHALWHAYTQMSLLQCRTGERISRNLIYNNNNMSSGMAQVTSDTHTHTRTQQIDAKERRRSSCRLHCGARCADHTMTML